jgi:hypothetical protein
MLSKNTRKVPNRKLLGHRKKLQWMIRKRKTLTMILMKSLDLNIMMMENKSLTIIRKKKKRKVPIQIIQKAPKIKSIVKKNRKQNQKRWMRMRKKVKGNSRIRWKGSKRRRNRTGKKNLMRNKRIKRRRSIQRKKRVMRMTKIMGARRKRKNTPTINAKKDLEVKQRDQRNASLLRCTTNIIQRRGLSYSDQVTIDAISERSTLKGRTWAIIQTIPLLLH